MSDVILKIKMTPTNVGKLYQQHELLRGKHAKLTDDFENSQVEIENLKKKLNSFSSKIVRDELAQDLKIYFPDSDADTRQVADYLIEDWWTR